MSRSINPGASLRAAARVVSGARAPFTQTSRAFTSAATRRIGQTPEGHVKGGANAEPEQFPNMRVRTPVRS